MVKGLSYKIRNVEGKFQKILWFVDKQEYSKNVFDQLSSGFKKIDEIFIKILFYI